MNKGVAEAARRIFGNLPHSTGRSGNKVLRKKIIGRKIAEVCDRKMMVRFGCGQMLAQAQIGAEHVVRNPLFSGKS